MKNNEINSVHCVLPATPNGSPFPFSMINFWAWPKDESKRKNTFYQCKQRIWRHFSRKLINVFEKISVGKRYCLRQSSVYRYQSKHYYPGTNRSWKEQGCLVREGPKVNKGMQWFDFSRLTIIVSDLCGICTI